MWFRSHCMAFKAFPHRRSLGSPGAVALLIGGYGVLELLCEHETWLEFLAYKSGRGLLTRVEESRLREFVERRGYLEISRAIADEKYTFGCPERREISKLGTGKKRVVYTFSEDENAVLKLLAYLLYRYDGALSGGCYAFRRDVGARRAFTDMAFAQDASELWCFKADISNYFNSIDVEMLCGLLRETITDDGPLLRLLEALLNDERSVWRGEIIREHKGVMAGTPISAFLANIYLKEMDEYFVKRGVRYARYSDDIIVFDARERIDEHVAAYRGFLEKYRLRSNPDKELLSAPGEAWSFLGFEYRAGTIDISRSTVAKLFGRIKRQSRSLRRWMLKNNAEPERALRAFNRKFNRKFYSADAGRELCWSRWFFPLINTDASLRAIDAYMQQSQRYLVTGTHNKSGYKLAPYELLRECGYRPLVAAYYQRRAREGFGGE